MEHRVRRVSGGMGGTGRVGMWQGGVMGGQRRVWVGSGGRAGWDGTAFGEEWAGGEGGTHLWVETGIPLNVHGHTDVGEAYQIRPLLSDVPQLPGQ